MPINGYTISYVILSIVILVATVYYFMLPVPDDPKPASVPATPPENGSV